MHLPVPDHRGLNSFIDYCIAKGGTPISFGSHVTTNRARLTTFQPHPDDVALSVGGLLSNGLAKLTLVTVFGDAGRSNFAAQRAAEDLAFARLVMAEVRQLCLTESTSSEKGLAIETVLESMRAYVERNPDCGLLLAPAAVGRHPDHRSVQLAAARLGCGIFWEDVAFWGIYGSSVDDRVLFTTRGDLPLDDFTLVAIDISTFLRVKAGMLACYSSQSTEIWRPLRYAWTAARECQAPFEYCERLFVRDDYIARLESFIGAPILRAGVFPYGTKCIRLGWAGTKV